MSLTRWDEFEGSAPHLAVLGRERLLQPGVVLVGTIRNDGSVRISPVEPMLWNGELWLGMMWQSKKALDLLRDPRILVHRIVTNRDGEEGEFKVRGVAEPVEDPQLRAGYIDTVEAALDWRPEDRYLHLFRVSIEDVTFIRFEEGDQRVVRWPEGKHVIRRITSATSVGESEDQGEF